MARIVGLMFRVAGLLMDEPGDGTGGGGTGDGTSAAGNDGTKQPGNDLKTDAGAGLDRVAAPDKKAEDERNRGILADLQKERKARQEFERQVQSFKQQLEQQTRRVQVLAGVNPKSEDETARDEVLERLRAVNPALADITADDLKSLREIRAQQTTLQAATEHHWMLHGEAMLTKVVDGVAKAFGGQLSERQLTRVKNAYVREAEDNPEFLARHDRGDQKLIDEFVKDWVEDFFEPARRHVTKSEVDRMRRVPGARDRSVAGGGAPKKINYSDPKALEDALVASFREHGGEFGN